MRARLLAPTVVALLLLAGCGIPSESSPRGIPSESVSPSGSSPSPSPSTVPGPKQQVTVYLVQDNQLAPVMRLVTRSPGPNDLLEALLQPPTEAEKEKSYRSVAFTGATADARIPPNGIVTVQLPPLKDDTVQQPTLDAILGYAQIVLTLTANDEVKGVVFVQDGAPIQPPDADGIISKEGQPVTAADYRKLVQEEPK